MTRQLVIRDRDLSVPFQFRLKKGLERVRAQGKMLGRPDGFTTHGPVLVRMKAEGYSQVRMSRETGLTINTVKGCLRRLEAATPRPIASL